MTDQLSIDDLPQPEYEGIVTPDELSTDGENPNEQNEETFALLCDNLRKKGWLGGPIITDKDGLIADGEHRLRAAQEIGLDEVPVRQYDIDDATRRLWRQELNKIEGEHDPTRDALEYDYLLSQGKQDDVQALTNARGEDLDELLAEIKLNGQQRVPYEYDSEHTIYFEDCVDGMRERVDDDSVDCILTDPPYGIDYTGRGEQEFDALENYDEWGMIEASLDEMRRCVTDDGHVYVWMGWEHYGKTEELFRHRFEHHGTLVWAKNNFGIIKGRTQYKYRPQYELCLYGSVADEPKPLTDASRLSDLLEYDRADVADYQHPTQKPVDLISHLLRNSTEPGDLVLDAFMGSGTTAVAAIQNNRDYIGFEIDEENYRSVIERRVGEAKRQVESETNQQANADD